MSCEFRALTAHDSLVLQNAIFMNVRSCILGVGCFSAETATEANERAWRLSEYRRRIERLSNIQIDGPSLE
eukprot:2567490-Amphidinium_carterae.1